MQSARRIYTYLMSGIGLGALVTGLATLLGVLLGRLGLGPSGDVVFGAEETIRQQLTLATALIAVSLPVWLIHWWLAERAVRPDRPNGLLEINAPERGLYIGLALTLLLVAGATGAAAAIDGLMVRLLGGDAGWRDVGGDLARAGVAMGFWTYHLRLHDRDWRRRGLTHQAAFLPRAARYGAALAGLLVLLFALVEMVDLVARLLLDDRGASLSPDAAWWASPLASTTSGALIGGAIWIGHWAQGGSVMADPGPRGVSERASRLRLGAFVATIVITSALTLAFLAMGSAALLEVALGVTARGSEASPLRDGLGAIVSAALFAFAWWLHARWLDGEPLAQDAAGAATVDRLRLYPVALVGLAFGAVGLTWLIGLLIEAVAGVRGIGGDDVWRRQLAQFLPAAVLGWAVWLWRWLPISARRASDPAAEAASTTRRTMLLVVLAVSVLAGIAAAGTILYRAFGALFGVTFSGSPVSELSVPIGVLLVAVASAVGHGALLRRDGRLRAEDATAGPEEATSRSVRLRLTGPVVGLDAALASLGGATPPGYALELEPEPEEPRSG